jgi:hypothetical protein
VGGDSGSSANISLVCGWGMEYGLRSHLVVDGRGSGPFVDAAGGRICRGGEGLRKGALALFGVCEKIVGGFRF